MPRGCPRLPNSASCGTQQSGLGCGTVAKMAARKQRHPEASQHHHHHLERPERQHHPRGSLLLLIALMLSSSADVALAHKCDVMVYFDLKTARCVNQGLESIPQDLGQDIKVLSFEKNGLMILNIDHFKNYPYLQEMYIAQNKIHTVAHDAFRGLHNLQILDLGGNKISTIPSAAFHHLSTVRILIMKGNPITVISANAFANLPQVEELNFQDCMIQRIDPKAFDGLSKLSEINLVKNEVRSLDRRMERSLPPNLKVFRIYRNPWNCDCKLRWLRTWIAKTKVNWDFAQNTPTCSNPGSVRGIDWKHMKEEQFACSAKITTNVTGSIEVTDQQNVTLDCHVVGDPMPLVNWFKNDEIVITNNHKKYTIASITDPEVPYEMTSRLTLYTVRKAETGSYKCTAHNTAGHDEIVYKLWMMGVVPAAQDPYPMSMSQESILGMAVGGAVFLLILVLCVVYGLRKRDKRRHAYRVREYKMSQRAGKKDMKDAEKADKNVPNATTELLCEKKEKEREKEKLKQKAIEKEEKEPMIKKNKMANCINHHDALNNEFKMKIFSYHSDDNSRVANSVLAEKGATETTCKETACRETACRETCLSNNAKAGHEALREVTPDLLKNNDHKCPNLMKQHSKEENPYVANHKSMATNHLGQSAGCQVVSMEGEKVASPGGENEMKENVKNTSKEMQLSSDGDSEKSQVSSIKSREDHKEEPLRRNHSGSKDSLSSLPKSSARSSPARSPTNSLPGNMGPRPQPQGMAGHPCAGGTLGRHPNHRPPIRDPRDPREPHDPRSDCLPYDKYQTLPAKPKPHNSYGPRPGPPPRQSSLTSASGPAAQAGVLSPTYNPPLPKGPHHHPCHPGSSPTKAQVQQMMRNFPGGQPPASVGAVIPGAGRGVRPPMSHPVPTALPPRGMQPPQRTQPLMTTKSGRTLVIPPPPMPPGGRSPTARAPSAAVPFNHSPANGTGPKKAPPASGGRTFSSMYEFPNTDGSPEVEQMPAPGTKTEFGTAV